MKREKTRLCYGVALPATTLKGTSMAFKNAPSKSKAAEDDANAREKICCRSEACELEKEEPYRLE